MTDFKNPRPSIRLEQLASAMVEQMKHESYSSMSLCDALRGDGAELTLHTSGMVAGEVIDIESPYGDHSVGLVRLDGRASRIIVVTLLGKVYEGNAA